MLKGEPQSDSLYCKNGVHYPVPSKEVERFFATWTDTSQELLFCRKYAAKNNFKLGEVYYLKKENFAEATSACIVTFDWKYLNLARQTSDPELRAYHEACHERQQHAKET